MGELWAWTGDLGTGWMAGEVAREGTTGGGPEEKETYGGDGLGKVVQRRRSPRGGGLGEVARRTRRWRKGVVEGRGRVRGKVAQGRRWSREGPRGGGGPGELMAQQRWSKAGDVRGHVALGRRVGVGPHGRRFSRRDSLEEKEDRERGCPGREEGQGRRSSRQEMSRWSLAKGEDGYPGEEVWGRRNGRGGPRKGAQGRRVSGDGDSGKEMAQGMLSGPGGSQE